MATKAQKQAFVAAMAPTAVAVGQQYGIDPKLIIAQSGIESNWGQSAPHNSYFGVKGEGPYGGVSLMTHENVAGKGLVAMPQTFRSYPSMQAAVEDYGRLLGTSPRYATVPNAGSLADQANALAAAGYANNGDHSAYANSIINAATGIDLSDFGMTPPADIPNAPDGESLPSIYSDEFPSLDLNPSMSQPPVPLAPSQPFSIPAFTSPADQIGLGDSLAFNPVTGPAALSLGSYNSSYPVVGTGNPLDYGSVAAGAGSGLADLNAVPTAPPAPTLASLLPSILAPTIADDSTGFAAPAGASLPPLPRTDPRPAVAPQQTVSINGHPYVVGQTYQTADGASFQANANGTFTKTANTFRNPTMLQLAIQSQAPGAMANLNNAVSTVKGAASNALSGVGSLLGGLFGGNSAPPTPTAPALSGDGGWGAFMAPASIPPSASSDNGGWGAYFAPTAPSAPSLGSDNGGWGDYSDNLSNGADLSSLSANIPASSVPQYISVAHQVAVPGSDPAGDAQSGVHWDDATGSFKLDSSPAPAAPTYKTVYEKELNPAYVAPAPSYATPPLAISAGYGETDPNAFSTKLGNWFGATPLGHIGSFLQGEAPVGGGGLLGMLTSGLSGSPKASGGLLGALTPQSSGGGLLGALMPSTNGYLYQPNGQGGYTNVGHAPGAPSYGQLAAQILSTNVNTGGYAAGGGAQAGDHSNQSLTG